MGWSLCTRGVVLLLLGEVHRGFFFLGGGGGGGGLHLCPPPPLGYYPGGINDLY